MFILAFQVATKFLEGQNYALMSSVSLNQAAYCQTQSRGSKAPHGYLDISAMTAGVKDGAPSWQTGNPAVRRPWEAFLFLPALMLLIYKIEMSRDHFKCFFKLCESLNVWG